MEVFDVSQEVAGVKNTDTKDLGISTLLPRTILQTSNCSAVKKIINNSRSFSKRNKEITNSIYQFGEPELEVITK